MHVMAPSCAACQKQKKGLCAPCFQKTLQEAPAGDGKSVRKSNEVQDLDASTQEAITLDKLAKIQRLHSPVAAPSLAVPNGAPLAACPTFPPMVPDNTGIRGVGSSQDAFMLAITTLRKLIISVPNPVQLKQKWIRWYRKMIYNK